MPTQEQWDEFDRPIGPDGGVRIGFPGRRGARVSGEGDFELGPTKLGLDGNKIGGEIRVDSVESIKESLFGTPIDVYDNPLGTIPSTLFTPTAAKMIGVDIELLEILVYLAIFEAASWANSGASDGEFNIGPLNISGLA